LTKVKKDFEVVENENNNFMSKSHFGKKTNDGVDFENVALE